MIAKGHDIHGVTLVGVVGADVALGFPTSVPPTHFSTQVAGRAGRGQSPGQVILQTISQDQCRTPRLHRLLREEILLSQLDALSAYFCLVERRLRSGTLDDALKWSGILGKWFDDRHEGRQGFRPRAHHVLKGTLCYHFVLKSPSREKLNATLRALLAHAAQQKIPRTQVVVDVDALWLM